MKCLSITNMKVVIFIITFLLLLGIGFTVGYVVGSENLLNKIEDKPTLIIEEICCLEDIENKTNICVPAKCYKYLNE